MIMNSYCQFLINGRHEASISPMDRGFAYGDGVFRTMLVNDGIVAHWHLHYRKLVEDCNALAIVCPSAELLASDIRRLCQAGERAAVKIVITRGEGDRGYALPALAQPARIVIKSPLPDYAAETYRQGVRLHVCQLRLGHQPMLAGIKHLNRLENVMARMEWSDAGIADGLLLDSQQHAIECTMSNLFMRNGELLVTPDLSRCGVAGVTRQRILELALRLGLQATIADIPFSKLMQAEEVIICNSLFGAWQVREIGRQQWPAMPLAEKLRTLLQD